MQVMVLAQHAVGREGATRGWLSYWTRSKAAGAARAAGAVTHRAVTHRAVTHRAAGAAG